jgi:uncharacterized protein
MPSIEEARRWYTEDMDDADDPVHGFDHVLRVYRLAESLALAEGADIEIVRAAALLHDANHKRPAAIIPQRTKKGKGEPRFAHQFDAAKLAHQILETEGWSLERIKAVQHCIRSHRFRANSETPSTLEAQVLFDADKLDAIGAIGVARAIAFAACSGQPAYAEPSSLFLRTGNLEENERHSAYHEYLFKLVKLKDRLYTPTARSMAKERHRCMVEFFERLALEAREKFETLQD